MGMEAAVVWLKVLHIITLLIWSAGLFYLPGLFIAHTYAQDQDSFYKLRLITRFAYVVITSPAAVLAVVSGTALIFLLDAQQKPMTGWLPLKLTAVALMVFFHVYCGYLVTKLRKAPLAHAIYSYLALLLIPTVLVSIVLWLVLAKPV